MTGDGIGDGLGSRFVTKERSFPGDIRDVTLRDVGALKELVIDLSIALTDQEYGLAGNMFYIWDAPDDTTIEIKINRQSESAVTFVEQTGVETPFDRLFITTPTGQTGNMTILYGTEAPGLVRLIDNRAALEGNLDAIRDELRGDLTPENWGPDITVGNAASVQIFNLNANRKACIIQAKAANTGLVYLGPDSTVATNKSFAELQAGMSFSVDDYRGTIYARASAVGQLVVCGEW